MVVEGWRQWAADHDWSDVRTVIALLSETFAAEDALLPDEIQHLQRDIIAALTDPHSVPG